MLVSKCCDVIPMLPTYENIGMCSRCRDITEFYEEKAKGQVPSPNLDKLMLKQKENNETDR